MPTYFMLVKLIPTLPHMLGLDPATYLKGIMCFLKSVWYCVCDICLFFPQHNFVQQYVDKTALIYFFVLFAAPKSCRGHMLETVQNTEDHLYWRTGETPLFCWRTNSLTMAAPASNCSTDLQTLGQTLSVCIPILQCLTMSCLYLLVLKFMHVYGLLTGTSSYIRSLSL